MKVKWNSAHPCNRNIALEGRWHFWGAIQQTGQSRREKQRRGRSGAPHAAGCMRWQRIPATLPPPTDPVIRGGTHQVICIALSISHYHQHPTLSSDPQLLSFATGMSKAMKLIQVFIEINQFPFNSSSLVLAQVILI